MNLNIPPVSEIITDYESFKPQLYLNDSSSLNQTLRGLSIVGHAQQGHGQFSRPYPQTTILDISEAIRKKDYHKIQEDRRRTSYHIDSARRTLEELVDISTFKDKTTSRLYDISTDSILLLDLLAPDNQTPLYGFLQFNKDNYKMENPIAFLRGFYIASQMDSSEMRQKTVKRFEKNLNEEKLSIGSGSCYVADLRKIRKENIDIKELSTNAQDSDKVKWFHDNGILIERTTLKSHKADRYNHSHINLFVREVEGMGCCDDATMITISMMHTKLGIEAAIDAFHGAALIDTIDTIDKFSALPLTGGTDEYLGKHINEIYKRRTGFELASEEEITTAIYLGAKNNHPSIPFSSSVRRFHELQRINRRGENFTPFQAHLKFIQNNEITPGIGLGFERFSSDKFYDIMDQRLDALREKTNIQI